MGQSSPEPLLAVKGVSVDFDGIRVLENVGFAISRGESVAIIGPNGAGKSVLFRAILGLIRYDGSVAIAKGARLGYVPQRLVVERDFPITVGEFLSLRTNDAEKILRVLGDVDPHHAAEHPDDEGHEQLHFRRHILTQRLGVLSGGQFQKVLIAWALLGEPDILLFDEPTAGIDVGGEESIYEFLRRLQRERGLALLVISHDLSIIYRYADRVLCLNRRGLCFGSPREVLDPKTLEALYGHGAGFYAHERLVS